MNVIYKAKDFYKKKLFNSMEEEGTRVSTEDAEYFYYPYWVKTKCNGFFEIISPENLPYEVTDLLTKIRDETH